MGDDDSATHPVDAPDVPDEDPTDSIDLELTDRATVGVSRGETGQEIGPPREYPDRVDVSVRPDEDTRLVMTVDVMAGDHARGYVDVDLTLEEARELGDVLDETVRWMEAEE
ncbi:hypothetical protein [Natrialbaceae archaeon AArc-T1-2]|uniref:hypothetical protein n=1 Tax=Natrialbaceae archaeon AArc-T1-2 TaxID=3053904 RepID=UPI00255B3A5D|nr:hypothetical protein [Natrialbaceae archaeon AArc-T1-2]WIV66830.1 hypothetical protein QQ977_14215 [Natrialbaceae archaeon AArc-T1-2]